MKDLVDRVEKKVQTKVLFRKRPSNQENWQITKRKKAHESGQEYRNHKGKLIAVKKVQIKKDCKNSCKFNCAQKIEKEIQDLIFEEFYKLDTNGKHSFIAQTSVCSSTRKEESRKKCSYTYFLMKGAESFRVCKSFYLATLAVSQKMVYNVHQKKDKVTGVVKPDGRGRHSSHYQVSEEQKQGVFEHINSFPVVDSHYCRAKTNKKYLEGGLNIEKMYDLYKEKCEKKKFSYVESSYYRYVFNTSFNINFHVPKTDRCEKCESIKLKKSEHIPITEEEQQSHNQHLAEKVAMRKEKEIDKSYKNDNRLLVVFDLENVINLPQAEIGSFFYKRKLTLYNLTAMTSSKQGYCAIWTELMSGRAGNDIASAFIQILKKVANDHPDTNTLICWSDSCVPQNRNSHISQAILEFLYSQEQITEITMKYSLAGHSCVQEVDNMHQQIELAMRVAEFFSPISFLRVLLRVNRTRPFVVIQMQKNYFKDFNSSSKMLHFSEVPYTKVFQLKFSKVDLHKIEYKTSHAQADYLSAFIGKKKGTRRSKNGKHPIEVMEQTSAETKILFSRKQKSEKQLSKEKMDDLRSMLSLMPSLDREYYRSIGVKKQ